MRLVLLRHGRTEANERRLYCGSSDVWLSAGGREELHMLKQCAMYPDTDGLLMITSGMRRTDETMRILFDRDPDLRMPDFREMDFGRFELRSYDELKNDPDYLAWITDETGEYPTPGGESSGSFKRRVFSALDSLDRDALILCHGGVIAALMQRLFPGEGKNMYQWQSGFGQGYTLYFDSDQIRYRTISAEPYTKG